MIEIGIIKDTPQNKIIDIRDKNQVIKAKYAIGKDDILKYTLMVEHYIEISFELNRNASFKRSDYIEWEGEKYTLRENYQPEQINKRKYKNILKFEAIEMFFKDIQYYYLNQGLKESEWRLTGNPRYFFQIGVDNINRYFGNTNFKIGVIEPTEIIDLLFDVNTNTFDAFTQVAEKCNAEWYRTGDTIHLLNKVSFGDEVDFETEVSVLSMKREEGEGSVGYTRILALGSTRNIPNDYRGSSNNEAVDAIYPKRLRIPTSKGDVIDAYPNMSPDEVVEGTVIFDEVYPKRVGTIEAIGTIEYQDVNEDTGEVTKWNAYKFKDSGINFKEEYMLPGQELKLQFVSGDLNSRDFALKFHPKGFSSTDNSQFYEIYRTDEYGKLLPNDVMKPKAGDKYVLYGFNIALVSDQYVPAGEKELYDVAVEWQKKQLRDTSVYECPTVIKHFKDNQMDLAIGQKVRLIKDIGSNRNLLLNSDFKNGLLNWAINYATVNIIDDTQFGKCVKAGTSMASRGIYQNPGLRRKSGKMYTISGYIKVDEPMKVRFVHEGGSGTKEFDATTEWQRFETHGVWNGTGSVCFYSGGEGTFYLANLQYEEGDKASEWTPAPEDVEGSMRSSRIMGFEKKLNNKFDAIYTVGDNSTYSRFGKIEQQIKELQVAGVVYENTGNSGVYVIKQFDSTRPTDFNVYSAQASDAKYFNKKLGGAIEGETLFLKDVQHQGKVITDVIQNSTFTAGQLGSGYQIKRDSNGQSYMEIDNLLVRREAVFNRLTIAEIKSVGGTILLSLASMLLSKVEVKTSTWKCFFDTDKGTIPNDFAIGDQAICRRFTGANIKYYWARVMAVGSDYIELSRADKDGSGTPAIGDEVVQLGNRTDVNRQYAIMLSTYGSDAPSINQYAGINSYNLTGKEVTTISPKGNSFTGSFTISSHGTSTPIYKPRGVFNNGTTYYFNDEVSHLGSLWVCIVNSTITTPSEGSSTWRKQTAGQSDIDKAANQVRTEYKADFVVLDTKIASKVSQTDFNALGQRVSTSESNITQLSNQITSVVETVDNISIGGRNLLLNSNFYNGLSSWQTNYTPLTVIDDTLFGKCLKASTDDGNNRGCHQVPKGRISQEIYAWSVWLRADTPRILRLVHENGNGTIDCSVTTEWKLFKSSGKWGGSGSWCIYSSNDRVAGNFYVANAKYERGNKQTDWTPAPEDTESQIKTAQSSANNAQNTADSKNRTYYQDAVPTAPSGGHKVGDLWYKTSLVDSSGNINADTSKNIYQLQYRWDGTTWRQINWSVSKSKIEQTDSSISLIVEKTGINSVGAGSSLYSMILQTEDKIVLEVSKVQVGGRNMFLNSNFKYSFRNWIINSSATESSKIEDDDRFGKIAKITARWQNGGIYQIPKNRTPKATYTISGYVKADTPMKVRFQHEGGSGTKEFDATTEWQRFETTGIWNGGDAVCFYSGGAGTFYLANLQYEEGNKSSAWTPALEDVQGAIDGKTTLDEVSSSLTINDNKITLASKTIELTGTTIAESIKAGRIEVGNLTIEEDGTLKAVNGEFSGVLKGVTGSFKRLQAIDDNGISRAEIGFSPSEGKLYFEGDMQHQGYDRDKQRSYRFLTSDLWCRGNFGAWSSNVLYIQGSYGYYYTKGLGKTDRVYVGLQSKVSSNNITYYEVPLYGTVGDASGFPVDMVIINTSSEYTYLLGGATGKQITVINSNDRVSTYVFSMGNRVGLVGGAVRHFYNIDGFYSPSLASNIIGQGWLAGAVFDNTWS